MKASGSGLTYQWQVSTNGGSTWGNSTAGGYSTASMWVTVTDSNIGRLYRCKITDSSGNVTYSQPGKIRNDPVAVTTQPIDFCGVSGDRATFTIAAVGSGLTYQWQVSTNGGNTWGNSTAGGYSTNSMWVNVTDSNGGYRYRCKVTDSSGNVVYSEPGEIKLARETWTFTYDADGMRTKRTNGSTTYSYVYNGSQLSQMTVDGNTLYFAYDASGTPLSVIYNGTAYYYATNLQGDVTAILNTSGTAVVTYTYDAWGKPLTIGGSMASTLGTHNPLRYRGYVYDNETGLYYLQSRYYNPQVGRFLNADAFLSTGHGLLGNNMFAYCNNNSVTYVDPSGYCVECVSKRFRSQVSVTSGDCLLGVAITAGLGLGVTIARAIEETAEEIKAWVEAQHGLTESRDNSVYVLKDPQNGNLVKYVGRTNDPDRRWSEHMHDSAHSARSGYTMIVLLTGLTKDEAILWEQVVISAYTITYLENARREIARKNIDEFQNYINAVTEIHTGISASEIYDLIAGR